MEHEAFDSIIVKQQGAIGYVCDIETYELLHLTPAGMDLYGCETSEDYEGKKCYKLLQGLDEPCPFCTNSKLKEGERLRWEHFNEKLQRWMSVDDTLVRVDGRLCRLEMAYDVTEQKERLSTLSNRLSTEEILVSCVQILAHEVDMESAVSGFLRTIGVFYSADRAYIFEFDFSTQTINNTYEWCAEGVTQEKDNLQNLPMEIIQDWLTKFEESGEFFITSLNGDLDPNSEDYRVLHAQGIESLMAAPLINKDDEIVGFLGVDDPAENVGDLTLLRSTSDFIIEELEKRRLMRELEHASYTDLLTGLLNRNCYIKALTDYEQTPPARLGVVFVDINGMKKLNDQLGHRYGDQVIVRVASIMRKHLEAAFKVYRIGGDEFVALCEDMDEQEFLREVHALHDIFAADSTCDVSVGSIWRDGVDDVDRLILKADELMYEEKQTYYEKVMAANPHPNRMSALQTDER